MASTITYKGAEYMLIGDGASSGSLARKATSLRLYSAASSPQKDGSGVIELPTGGGYTAGGVAIVVADWTYTAQPGTLRLKDVTWNASSAIAGVAGAYIVDGSGNVLVWWARSGGAVTVPAGEALVADDLTIRI